jgi:hypothetical protein
MDDYKGFHKELYKMNKAYTGLIVCIALLFLIVGFI